MQQIFFRLAKRGVLYFCLPLAIIYGSTIYYVYAHMDGNAVLPADCGIVFGTAVWPVFDAEGDIVDSTAGPGIRRRVATAARLLEQGSLKHLFFSGGKGEGNQRSEAEVMRAYAMTMGVNPQLITVEDRSRSTWENLLYTRPLTSECSSIVAISDGYHLARIALQASYQGFSLTTYPAGQEPSDLFIARNLLREALGIDWLVLIQLLT